ncbi:MAG TPA: DUF5808 domain-containing protein [Lacisediminihabitans sp.]|jgi:uncharacterized membrane protein|nr:DUF5808 domain-containing protein [Lacisediminihabitans sp.]HXD61201.1 DUF5808 domain-containing protein [Lacisediminihabitans sp.]
MTWFAITFSALLSVLLGALLYAMPAITHPTLPLGVSVPQARVADPVIVASVRRYRRWILMSLVLGLVLSAVLGFAAPTVGIIVPVLLVSVLGMGSYVVSREAIARTKREGGWYEDVPVRLAANVTAARVSAPIPFGWYLAATVLLAIAAGIGVAVYPALPDPLPIHWDLNGVANGFAQKSVWSAFGVVLVGLGVVALLFALSFLVRVARPRRMASDSPALATRRAEVQQHLLGGLLGQITLITSALLAGLTIAGWLAPTSGFLPIVSIVLFLGLLALAIAAYFVGYRRAMVPRTEASGSAAPQHPTATAVDAPDDDHYWKGGLVYVNRRDPALLVPKRFGVGWTINLGHPAGVAIGVVILLIIAGSITLAIVTGSRR